MVELATDAAAMKVHAGISKTAGIISCPPETEVFPIGGEHGIFALAIWGDSGRWLATECLVCLAFEWEMVESTVAKTVRTLALSGYL